MPENKQFTDHLKVVFTNEEIQAKGVQLALTMGEADQLEAEKKAVVSDFKGRIDAKNTIIKKLKDEVNNGHAYLPVRCEIQYNSPEPAKATIVRLDTGEIVTVRDMTGDERQVKITEFMETEQADSPFENQTTISDADKKVIEGEDHSDLTPDRYTSDEFKKHFQLATTALDAEKFDFPPGLVSKMADKSKIKILRQDGSGTVFTMGKMADGLIFFDKTEKTDVFTTLELIEGRIQQLEGAIKNEPDSKGLKDWKKELKKLKERRKQMREVHNENAPDASTGKFSDDGKKDDTVLIDEQKAKKQPANRNIDNTFAKRPAQWFIDRVGKEIECKNADKNKFNGVMKIDDQEDAEYQASIGQNELGFTYRDVQK